ncbi:MAG: saccharopine dehydrogenase family protein [Pseudomonadota bacterium]
MPTIHWLGTGLSTVPGIRRLAVGDLPLVLWNRTVEKAHAAIEGLDTNAQVREFDLETVGAAIEPGDIVVSMLPGTWHVPVAQLAIEKEAHFVSSSYISKEMAALDKEASYYKLSLVNEVGLDPGIDHLMAHGLVDRYRDSAQFDPANTIRFRSFCGGFPKIPNDFRYKFSWSPLGVLKALRSPARSIRDGDVVDTARPWHALSDYEARLPGGSETFQAYPNRDSLPFMSAYHFDPDWQVDEFVRGTLRLNGWSDAWAEIFSEIETLEGEAGDARLQEMSDDLWRTQSYDEGEPDRVVLCVELEARSDDKAVWHHSHVIDASGNESGSAMGRLVSLPVSLAIEAIAAGKISAGVSAAPSDTTIIKHWFDVLRSHGDEIHLIDHLS